MKSHELFGLIAAVHAPPEWALFGEVHNGTGGDSRRRADAIAMNLYPSRGLTIRGFEIKVSKSDLKNEHRDPTKAEEIAQFCDEWWLVTPPDLVTDITIQVPSAWGLMVANEKGLRTVQKASRLEAVPPTRSFVAAILRRASESLASQNAGWIRREEIVDQIRTAEALALKLAPEMRDHRLREADELRNTVAKFAEETGIDLAEGRWKVAAITRALAIGRMLVGEHGHDVSVLNDHLENASQMLQKMRKRLIDAGIGPEKKV